MLFLHNMNRTGMLMLSHSHTEARRIDTHTYKYTHIHTHTHTYIDHPKMTSHTVNLEEINFIDSDF